MTPTRKAIILVAGEGKRLLPFTLKEPKCFARVGGTRILENALRNLAELGCEQVRIVTGHHAERVRSEITDLYAGMAVDYVINADFKTTNSMYSLALGLEGWAGPTWVLEGDVFFEEALLQRPPSGEIAWYVDSSLRHLDGAFVTADENAVARDLTIVRDLSQLNPRQNKSAGILHLSSEGAEHVRTWLRAGIAAGRQNVYYDLILADHLREGRVHVVDVAGTKWFEVDTHDDLHIATELFRGR